MLKGQMRFLSYIAVGTGLIMFVTGVAGTYTVVPPCGGIGVCRPAVYDYDYLAVLIGIALVVLGSLSRSKFRDSPQ